MQQQDRLRLAPGIGEVIDLVMHVEIGGGTKARHGTLLP